MGGVGQIHWYSFRRHTSHAICFGFAGGDDLLPPKYSTNMQIQTFQLSEVIDHSNNRDAYNQVTQITHLNFIWGMLGVSSYLWPKQFYFRSLWNFRVTRQLVGHLTPINSRR